MTGMNFVRLGKKVMETSYSASLFSTCACLTEYTLYYMNECPPLQCSICVVRDYVYFIFLCPAVNMSNTYDGADATNLS